MKEKYLPKTIPQEYQARLRQIKDSCKLLRSEAGEVQGFSRSIYRFTDDDDEDMNLMVFRDDSKNIIGIFCLELEKSMKLQAKWDEDMNDTLGNLSPTDITVRIGIFKDFDFLPLE